MKQVKRLVISYIAALLIFTSVAASDSQQLPPEFGQFSELAGMHKAYIWSDDLEARKTLIKEIENYVKKNKVSLDVVDTSEKADMIIAFGGDFQRTTYKDAVQIGELIVFIRGAEIPEAQRTLQSGPYRLRIVYNTKSSRAFSSGITFQRSPTKKAIRKFLDELSKLQKSGK